MAASNSFLSMWRCASSSRSFRGFETFFAFVWVGGLGFAGYCSTGDGLLCTGAACSAPAMHKPHRRVRVAIERRGTSFMVRPEESWLHWPNHEASSSPLDCNTDSPVWFMHSRGGACCARTKQSVAGRAVSGEAQAAHPNESKKSFEPSERPAG